MDQFGRETITDRLLNEKYGRIDYLMRNMVGRITQQGLPKMRRKSFFLQRRFGIGS